ncbi:MAG: hypothetical protein HWE08_11805 [Alphaproteobacteria bacterium]|nr:hypothetical protein [Alphaproteobacteria bacterium]
MTLNTADMLTLAGVTFAFLTWLITHLKSQKELKLHNTINLINNLSVVEHLQQADISIRKIMLAGKISENEALSPETEKALVTLLDYYEFLAELYWNKTINRKAVSHLRGGLMTQLFLWSKPYIQSQREIQTRSDLWQKFEKLSMAVAKEK